MPRKTGTIKSNKTYFIVVEGETEYKYFDELKQTKKIRGFTIKIAKAKHSQLESIFTTASEAQKSGVYSSIWCVYDYDVVSKGIISKNAKKLKQNITSNNIKDGRIYIADSHPEFEVWFLLHYTIPKPYYNNKNELTEELKKHLPNYKKAMDSIYSMLNKTNDSTKNAIKNSKILAKRNKDNQNKDTSFCNVYKIFEDIKEFI